MYICIYTQIYIGIPKGRKTASRMLLIYFPVISSQIFQPFRWNPLDSMGKSPVFVGKSSINGPMFPHFSM